MHDPRGQPYSRGLLDWHHPYTVSNILGDANSEDAAMAATGLLMFECAHRGKILCISGVSAMI